MRCLLICALLMVGSRGYSENYEGLNPSPSLISIGTGVYNILRTTENAVVFQAEYKGTPFFGKKYFKVRPLLATLLTSKASFWLGGGVNFDIYLASPLTLTLGFAPGYFLRGSGKNLGYPLEMRSSIELSYRLASEARFGAQFYHLSNGSLSNKNPGTEVLVFFYAFPVNFLKR